MGALAKTLQRSRTPRIEKATLTPTSALGEHLQNRQLESRSPGPAANGFGVSGTGSA